MLCSILKLITLCLIIVLGLINFNITNLSPFTIEEQGGIEGTFLGASIIFYGYLGFDFITTLSEDSKNPVKDIPSAVMLSSLICTVLYFLTAISLVGMARIETLNPETAMADAFYHVDMPWATIIIYICAIFGITAACFTNFIVSIFRTNSISSVSQ